MTLETLRRLFVIPALAATLAVGISGCTPPPMETPAQVMVALRGTEAATLATFNRYGSQRPFCGDPGAGPLCPERSVVIQGAKLAKDVDSALDAADKVVKVSGVSDVSWAALADPKRLVQQFKDFISGVVGQ